MHVYIRAHMRTFIYVCEHAYNTSIYTHRSAFDASQLRVLTLRQLDARPAESVHELLRWAGLLGGGERGGGERSGDERGGLERGGGALVSRDKAKEGKGVKGGNGGKGGYNRSWNHQ